MGMEAVMRKRLRDYGIVIGTGTPGPRNKITDVKGVTVGHCTVDTQRSKTGVTVIIPCADNPFSRKLTAAVCIQNGFGKSQGLAQIEELGTLETPIALTNTLNVGIVHDAMVDYMLKVGEQDGISITSVNPVVGECNDSVLNDISLRAVKKTDVMEAIKCAGEDFEEGDVGAGKGTVCFGLKGGIGSASRVIVPGDKSYTIGALVQSNFGVAKNLVINHKPVGRELVDIESAAEDRGSIMMIIATDLPVSAETAVQAGSGGPCKVRFFSGPRKRGYCHRLYHRQQGGDENGYSRIFYGSPQGRAFGSGL